VICWSIYKHDVSYDVYMCIYIYIYIYTHICIYIYICMQFFLKPRHQGDDASPQGAKNVTDLPLHVA
jgi:hypothetical protein